MLFSADHSESMLYLYFHEFYREVVRLKRLIREGGVPSDNGQIDTQILEQVTPAYIQHCLLPILERQRADAAQRGGEYGATLYREAQYLMVTLADEIFLHRVNWHGKEAWRSNLLEARLFDSYIGGERLFKHLDKLLQERNPVYADLGRLYLITLSLGFQGKYRNSPDEGVLDGYRRQLFAFVAQRSADGLQEYFTLNPDKHLFPSAYAFTLKEPTNRRLPPLRFWYLLLFLVIMGLLLSSHLLWHHFTDDLSVLMNQILQERGL